MWTQHRRAWALIVLFAALLTMTACMPVTAAPVVGRAPKPAAKPVASAHPRALDGRGVGVSLYGSVLEWSQTDLRHDLDHVRGMGAKWVRVPFNWISIETQRGQYNWAPVDRVVAAANARHLHIEAVVSYTPQWARPAGRPGTDPPTNLNDYANFMSKIVARYAPRGVHTWEVWNEPNIASMWTPKPNAAAYTALLKKAYVAIKRSDRKSVVLTAGLSPAYNAPDGSQNSPVTFTRSIYRNHGGHSFDALALHPSTYPYRSTYRASWSAFQQAPQMHRIMQTFGDAKKKIWATEIGFPTGTSNVSVSEQTQAKDLVESLRAWNAYSFAGPVFVYSMRDEGPDRTDHYQNFGLVHTSGTPKPAYLALKRALLG